VERGGMKRGGRASESAPQCPSFVDRGEEGAADEWRKEKEDLHFVRNVFTADRLEVLDLREGGEKSPSTQRALDCNIGSSANSRKMGGRRRSEYIKQAAGPPLQRTGTSMPCTRRFRASASSGPSNPLASLRRSASTSSAPDPTAAPLAPLPGSPLAPSASPSPRAPAGAFAAARAANGAFVAAPEGLRRGAEVPWGKEAVAGVATAAGGEGVGGSGCDSVSGSAPSEGGDAAEVAVGRPRGLPARRGLRGGIGGGAGVVA